MAAEILSKLADKPDSVTANFALPYLALCHMKLENTELYLKYLRLATTHCTELTAQLFEELFPGVQPEDIYYYAYKNIYGCFPNI